MKNKRQNKVLLIVALALTTLALAVGFAAFSTTLSISSNATVTPNEEDFKIMIYGFKSQDVLERFSTSLEFEESDLSSTIASPHIGDRSDVTADDAIIVNSIHKISNIKVGFTNPGTEVPYFFIVRNEGKYDAYLDLTEYEYNAENGEYIKIPPTTGTCTPKEGATKELVDKACDDVINLLGVVNPNGESVTTGASILEIPKGKYIILASIIGYQDTEDRADGPFDITFPDLELSFSTAK